MNATRAARYLGVFGLGMVVVYAADHAVRAERDLLREQLASSRQTIQALEAGFGIAGEPRGEKERRRAEPGGRDHAALTPLEALPELRPEATVRGDETAVVRAAAAPVTSHPPLEPTAGEGPEPVDDASSVDAAKGKLEDYLERTAGSDRSTRLREGRQLLDELRVLGDAATVALLETLEEATTSRARSAAATLLGRLRDPAALPVLQDLVFAEPDVMVRRAAARGLRLMDTPAAVPVFESMLQAQLEDRFVRFQAAYGLAQQGEPAGVEHLVSIFEDAAADGPVRYWAFRVLQRLDDPLALPAMRQLVGAENDVAFRVGALEFLGRHGSGDDLTLVRTVLDAAQPQPAIAQAAENALRELSAAH